MEFFNGSPTFSIKPIKDKSGNVHTNPDGSEKRGVSLNFNWKSVTASLVFLLFIGKAGAFYFQTVDTTRAVKILNSKVDTLQNKVIVEQHAMNRKMDLLVTLLDPEKGGAKLKKIDDDKAALLRELESKSAKKQNGN